MKTDKKLHSAALISVIAVLFFIIVSCSASAATLTVDSHHYKTIQSAVNAALSGDTISVASGTYHETVNVDKGLNFIGSKYPIVDGFYFSYGGGSVNGFKFVKSGITSYYDQGPSYIRNNYFSNCGIDISGDLRDGAIIMNNQITGGTILLYDIKGVSITGNTLYKCKVGLHVYDLVYRLKSASKNKFKQCDVAVITPAELLNVFTDNKYVNNKVNIQTVDY